MERRNFFEGFAKAANNNISKQEKIALLPPPVTTLDPYTGVWDKAKAAHLLRRATYGFNIAQLNSATGKGLNTMVENLFNVAPITDFPLNYDFDDDPEVPKGTTWINAKLGTNAQTSNYRYRSIQAWRVGRTISGEQTIREKMVTFWINHFGIADVNDGRYNWQYISTLYEHFGGNFKTLIEKITIDPSMLRFLNGNTNTKNAPNENFAREVMELFTLGKGPIAGPGDYTNYTEADVLALAKAFTGWADYNYRNSTREGFGSRFIVNNHDTSIKTLSPRLNNVKINNAGDKEYLTVLNVIFQQAEVSKFIARKLYRYFVYYTITPEIEAGIIEPMAQLIRDQNYNLVPALKALFKSKHFYDSQVIGGVVVNPMDFMAQSIVAFGLPDFTNYIARYRYWYNMDLFQGVLQMRAFDPPTVSGWTAYYQEPAFYQLWINSVTFPIRIAFTDTLHVRGRNTRGVNVQIDSVAFAEQLSAPNDLNKLIDDINILLFVRPFTTAQRTAMKQVLNPGKTDADWKTEYDNWKKTPTNTTLRAALGTKISNMLRYASFMPEYQLS